MMKSSNKSDEFWWWWWNITTAFAAVQSGDCKSTAKPDDKTIMKFKDANWCRRNKKWSPR